MGTMNGNPKMVNCTPSHPVSLSGATLQRIGKRKYELEGPRIYGRGLPVEFMLGRELSKREKKSLKKRGLVRFF